MRAFAVLLCFSLCLLALVSPVHTINCVSCVGWSNSGCNDPYNEETSDDIPVPGNDYCIKMVYANYIERMAGGRSCTPGSGPGGSTRYCCSDKDYCNGTPPLAGTMTNMILITAISLSVSLTISS